MSPEIVLVTGDLTEDGLMSEFKMAANELGKLKVEKVIYVRCCHNGSQLSKTGQR